MTDAERTAFAARLREARAAIISMRDESAGARAAVELDQTSVGRLSRMDAIQAQSMALATERRRAAELLRIDQALARIADGSFGECVVCGDPIAPKRLDLAPATPTCLACAARS